MATSNAKSMWAAEQAAWWRCRQMPQCHATRSPPRDSSRCFVLILSLSLRRVWWRRFAHGLYAGNGHLERRWFVCCNSFCSHCLVCNQTLLVCPCLSRDFAFGFCFFSHFTFF